MESATSASNAAASILRALSTTNSSNIPARSSRSTPSARIFNIRRTRSPPANTGGTVTSRIGRVRRPSSPTRSSTTFGHSSLTKDREVLLSFYDFPAAHWVHLRTTNPIESTFATVRARTRVTKGAGSRRRGLVMAFKVLDAAQARWRKVETSRFCGVAPSGFGGS